VLVIGGGMGGVQAAREIADQGYRVTLVEAAAEIGPARESRPRTVLAEGPGLAERAARVQDDPAIEVLTDTRLDAVAGLPGDFRAWLSTPGDVIERRFGALVLATEFDTAPLFEGYGLTAGGPVVGQGELEDRLAAAPGEFAGRTVAFVAGFAQPGTPLAMQRIFHSVRALQQAGAAGVYVYVGDLKVADDGLERLYREGRDGGAIYFKLPQAPDTTVAGDAVTLGFEDPVLRHPVHVTADLLVVEEALRVAPDGERLAAMLRLDVGPRASCRPTTSTASRWPPTARGSSWSAPAARCAR